jgi:excisionase family DNA binding protein
MLTVKQAAERAGVSPSLIYALVAEGRLRHIRLGREGRRGVIRIRAEDLVELIANCVRDGSPLDEGELKFIR